MTTQPTLIFLPVLLQIALTVWMYIRLASAKAQAVKNNQVDEARRALHDDAWPESVQKINNNIRNQFEVPVLFYVLVVMLFELGVAGVLAQGLAWAFVLSRMAHAYVHTGSNVVAVRRPIFMLGCLLVLAMLVLAAVALLG